jgi:endonuclease/exonuclease/phosphatase family metal-dependent hydrolase
MRRRPRTALSLLAFLLLPSLGACSAGSTSVSSSHSAAVVDRPIRVRILTYNIHHGQGTDGVFDLPRIAQVIKDQDPDLVALQEVDNRTTRASGVDQAAELGRLTGMHHVFGKAMDYAGGGYGEAILSRFTIIESRNHGLPFSPGREPRAAIAAVVRIEPGGPDLVFVGTHFDHTRDPADRISQARRINDLFVRENGPPAILAGDLNAVPGSGPMNSLLRYWSDASRDSPAPTIPVVNPTRRIDYVLYRPAGSWRIVESRVIDERIASDHRPLLVVLEYTPPG